EQRLLRLLVENRGRVLTRAQLLDAVWEGGDFVEENALSVAMRRLRNKLPGLPVRTVYGVGYAWQAGEGGV
ncbi:MAG: winged helix-turn-helix domain-containing protein, partial [Blautia massiliensis (ex Durand et al. 2017)]